MRAGPSSRTLFGARDPLPLRLARAFGLAEGEGGRALRLLGFVFSFSFALVTSKAAQSGLFLMSYPRSAIPWAFAASAVTLASASLGSVALAARLGPVGLVRTTLVGSIGLLLALRAALALEVPGAPFVLYVIIEAMSGLLLIQGWSVVSEAADPRSAKRLLPIAGVGASAAWALGGLFTRPVSALLGTEALLVVAPVLLALSLAFVRLLAARDVERTIAPKRIRVFEEWRRGLDFVRKTPLMRVVLVLSVVALLTEQLMDFQLMSAARERYADKAEMAGFFGTFYGLTALASLLTLFGLSGRLLARLGAPAVLFITAALTSLIALGGAIAPGFALAVALRGTDRVLKQALWSSGAEQLQTPLPVVRRAQSRALIRGVLAPAAYAASALGLAALPAHLDLRFASLGCFCGTLLLGGVVALRLRPAYEGALKQAIDDRRLDLDATHGHSALDPVACGALGHELASPDAERSSIAAEILRASDSPLAQKTLSEGLSHPSESVRVQVVAGLGRAPAPELAPALSRALADDPSVEVRHLAARALRSVREADARPALEAARSDEAERVRLAAEAALAVHDREGGVATLVGMLLGDEASALEALDALPERAAEHPRAIDTLARLLEPETPLPVRRAALDAVTRIKVRALASTVVKLLDDARLGSVAAERISEWGDDTLGALLPSLSEATSAAASRVASVLSVARAGVEAEHTLLAHDDPAVREQAARALSCVVRRRGRPPFRRDGVEPFVLREVLEAHRLTCVLAGLAHDDGTPDWTIDAPLAFLGGEIELRLSAARRRVLHLLGLLDDRGVLRAVEYALRRRAPGSDAKVAELLELGLSAGLRRMVVPLFDRLSLRERVRAARGLGLDLTGTLRDPLRAIVETGDKHVLCAAMISYGPRFAERYPAIYAAERHVIPLFERMISLRRVPLFSELSGEDLRGVAEILEEVELPAGRDVFQKGEPGEDMYVVLDGQVAIRDGELELAKLGPGELLGELAVLDRDVRMADAHCLVDTRLLRLRGADLTELMARRPQIQEQILLVVVRRLRSVTQRLQ
jgi:HEAT repeat protein